MSSSFLPGQSSWSSTSSSSGGTTKTSSGNKNLLYLPDPGAWPITPVTPRDDLNKSATTAVFAQDTKAAENSPLPILYGTVRVGPKVANAIYLGTSLVMLAVWGHGEVDSILELEIDDKPLAAGVIYTHYTGGSGNIIDPTLVAAFAAQVPSVVYADTLPGICYSVVTIPNGNTAGFPRLNAIIKGLKVYDPRTNYLTKSSQFNAWSLTDTGPAITVGVNATLAPDGTNDADSVTLYAGSSRLLSNTVSTTISGTGEQTVSVYAKALNSSIITLNAYYNGDSEINVAFTLTDAGSAGTGGTITKLPNGWYRCSVLVPARINAGTILAHRIWPGGRVGSDGTSVYLWGASIEPGSTYKGYIATDTSAILASTRHSDIPALCIGDFISNTVYGMNRLVDYATVGDVAFDNSYMVGTIPTQERSRILDLALETVQTTQAWLDTLRTYASCWIIPSPTGFRLISDKAGDSVAAFNHADGKILTLSNLKKRGIQSVPTVMTVTYRDTTTKPYKDGTAVVTIAGQRRESTVSLPGITRYSQAYRESFERLKKLNLNDLSCSLTVFDEGLKLDVSDIITVTHPIGLTNKAFRVMGINGEYGRFDLTLVEYDPAVYNNSTNLAPTTSDTELPSLSVPPAVTSVVMVEELFQLENGTTSSRWRVTWSCADYVFLGHYRAELWIGTTLIHAGNPNSKVWATPAVQESQVYTAKIYAISSIGSVGTAGTQAGTAQGKLALPGNVPSISAFEAGGRVYVSWLPAVDIDIWRYEVRYGAAGASFTDCLLIDKVDALTLVTDLMPVGTWVLQVKAIDSIGQYSVTSAQVSVTVTSDAAAFLIDTKLQTNPVLSNMQEYAKARTDLNRYFITEDSVVFATKFPSNLSTYTSPISAYHNSLTSAWTGETEDFGLLLGGQWTGAASVSDVSGSHISYLGNSVDNVTWNYPVGLSQKINARFAKLKHEALTTSTLLVTIPDQSIRIDAIPRQEVGSGISSASGPVTITLTNSYVALKELTITPQGSTPISAIFDRVLLSPVSGLSLSHTVESGGNAYVYWQIATSTRVFLAGDYFEYDVYIENTSATNSTGVGGIELETSGGSARAFGLSDAYGATHNPTIAPNTWVSRSIPLTPLVGLILNTIELCDEVDVAGFCKAIYRNIRITDGAGVTRLTIWSSGEPVPNQNGYSNLNNNIQCGPVSSFQVHAFNDAGARVPAPFRYNFQGV